MVKAQPYYQAPKTLINEFIANIDSDPTYVLKLKKELEIQINTNIRDKIKHRI
jgi:hypothetical protein